MGGGESRSREVLRYFDKEWEYIQTNKHGVKIFRNRDNDKEAEVHNEIIDPKTNIFKEYDIYNYRRIQENALVSVYAVENMRDDKPNLCGNRDCLKVLTESIPIRANDINNLSFKEGLYMLSECLRGFDDCYAKVGGFDINEQMIGLNNRGHVKVWLNQNFPNNHPAHEKPMLQITTTNLYRNKASQDELEMLERVVEIVNGKVAGGFPEDFRSIIKKQCNFVDAYHTTEDYCKQNNVDIPDRIIVDNAQAFYHQPFAPRTQGVESTRTQVREVNREENGGEFRSRNQNDNFSFKDYTSSNNVVSHSSQRRVEQPSVVLSPPPSSQPSSFLPQPQPQPQIQHIQRESQSSFNPSRDTLINKLPRDTLVSKHQQRQSKTHTRANIFEKKYESTLNPTTNTAKEYEPPNLIRYESTYQYQPKVSVRNIQNQTSPMVRGTSPPSSPRSFNFSYQNNPVQRQASPLRSNFVTSQRYQY